MRWAWLGILAVLVANPARVERLLPPGRRPPGLLRRWRELEDYPGDRRLLVLTLRHDVTFRYSFWNEYER